MASIKKRALQVLRQTPVRSFVLIPMLVLTWQLLLNQGRLHVQPPFVLLLLWGYLQYRLCGLYRIRHGGGGPGLGKPPERLVDTGPYAWTRNPMYLGHILFLIGLTLTLGSLLAGLLTVATAVWFHRRVLDDEKRLAELLGPDYLAYKNRVKRWIPGLF